MHRKLENEVKIMSGLHHPHIVQYVESVQTPEHIYIIMEYVRWGDVAKLFREQGCISEELAKTLAKQMLSALKYLHDRKITHRDIKPDNILISEKHPNAIFKLADFGLSKNVQGTFLTTFCGTLLYCAPEVFPDGNIHKQGVKRRRGQKPTQDLYDSKVDIYSLAAVLWHVTAGTPPVAPNSDRNGQGMYDNIMATMLDTTGLYAKNISEPCINILCGMLQKDPSNRPTAHRCLTHAWLDDGTTVPGDNNLESIAEEDVSQEAGEQLSQLSIHQVPEEVDDEFNDEVGDDVLDDEELNQMINVHQSKRARPDPLFPRFQLRDQEHVSSPEQSFQSRDLVSNIVGESFEAVPRPTGRQRLFGEIGESALQSSGYLNVHANEALSQVASNNGVVPDSVLPTDALAPAQPDLQQRRHLDSSGQRGLQPDASFTSPSLFGAEALVEDMNMASPQSPASNPQTPNEPVTPRTPDVPQHNSLERHSQQASNFSDSTPKAKPALNRQISLPRLPSLYYDPRDPNTHNLEHASKISGIDYVNANGSANLNEVPLPDTAKVSTQDSHVNEEAQSTPAPAVTTLPSELGIRPPPRRLGKLIATSDSFNPQLILPIDKNKTSWGRLRENDLVYEPRSDTRIPKTAFTIFWHSSDRESINQLSQEGKDWTSLENVQVGIVTGATSGITINGNLLKKTDRKGNWQYVWLHTGDIVQVYQDNHGSECLKFKCEFYFGNGKEPRPVGKSFIIQHSSSPAS
jgi:serine/threonine protein kinase